MYYVHYVYCIYAFQTKNLQNIFGNCTEKCGIEKHDFKFILRPISPAIKSTKAEFFAAAPHPAQ